MTFPVSALILGCSLADVFCLIPPAVVLSVVVDLGGAVCRHVPSAALLALTEPSVRHARVGVKRLDRQNLLALEALLFHDSIPPTKVADTATIQANGMSSEPMAGDVARTFAAAVRAGFAACGGTGPGRYFLITAETLPALLV